MNKKRILITGGFHFPYGTAPASRVKNIAIGFEQNQCEVDIIALCPPPGEEREIDKFTSLTDNIKYSFLKSNQGENENLIQKVDWFIGNWAIGKKLKAWFASQNSQKNYDAIFIYGTNYSMLAPSIKLANQENIPVITDVVELPRTFLEKKHYLNPVHLDNHIGMKYVANHSKLVTVITRYLDDCLKGGADNYLLPSVQDWSNSSPPKLEKSILDNATKKIVYVGNLIERDAPNEMFEFIRLLSRKANIKLILLGRFMNNPAGQRWINKIKDDSQLANCIEIVGEVTEEEKNNIYLEATAFILPRRDHKDEIASFPTRLIEYLIEGKLVIASPIGDIPYYLSDEELIFLEKENLDKSVDNTIATLENKVDYLNKCTKGFEKAQKTFNAKNHMNQILSLVQS